MGRKGSDSFGYFGPAIASAVGFLFTLVVLALLLFINLFAKAAILQRIIDIFYANLLLLLAISLALGYGSAMGSSRTLAPFAPLVSALGATLIVILVIGILEQVVATGVASFSRTIQDNIMVVFGIFAAAGYAGYLMQMVRAE